MTTQKDMFNFSCLNPRLPSQYSFIVDLYWLDLSLNLARVDPTHYLRNTLDVNKLHNNYHNQMEI